VNTLVRSRNSLSLARQHYCVQRNITFGCTSGSEYQDELGNTFLKAVLGRDVLWNTSV